MLLLPSIAESAELKSEAVQSTLTSLSEGITTLHGKRTNPRDSGFRHHSELLNFYASGLRLPKTLPQQEIIDRVKKERSKVIRIFSITEEEEAGLRQECPVFLKELSDSMHPREVGAFIYLSADRKFQRKYIVQKEENGNLKFIESQPLVTSKKDPRFPTIHDIHPSVSNGGLFTPLGLFKIPLDGVRPALLGEVTKIERLDITKYYFEPIKIDGATRYFVKSFGQTSHDEIVTVTGDTHLLWSPEINGRGIKIHDTTEVDSIEKPESSGCIRSPAVRRFTLLTANNRFPTQVYIYWAKTKNIRENDQGFGGIFGGEKIHK